MIDWAAGNEKKSKGPVIIRYPKTYCPQEVDAFSLPIESGRGVFVSKSGMGNVCLAFTGSLYREVLEAAVILKENGIEADLYNLRFLKPIDEDYLVDLINSYKLIAFIEEGMKEGGFGEYTASLALQRKCTAKVTVLAAESSFLEEDKALGTREQLLAINGLNGKEIAKTIKDIFPIPYPL
jgi:1-deoxy-D-xylulose-5-phosphate synthase